MSKMTGREICNKALDLIGGKGKRVSVYDLGHRQEILFRFQGATHKGTVHKDHGGLKVWLYNNGGLGIRTEMSKRFSHRSLVLSSKGVGGGLNDGKLKLYEKIEKKDERYGESEAIKAVTWQRMTASEVAARKQSEGRVLRHAEIEPLSVGQLSRSILDGHCSAYGKSPALGAIHELNKPLNETEKKEEDLTLCSNVLWE